MKTDILPLNKGNLYLSLRIYYKKLKESQKVKDIHDSEWERLYKLRPIPEKSTRYLVSRNKKDFKHEIESFSVEKLIQNGTNIDDVLVIRSVGEKIEAVTALEEAEYLGYTIEEVEEGYSDEPENQEEDEWEDSEEPSSTYEENEWEDEADDSYEEDNEWEDEEDSITSAEDEGWEDEDDPIGEENEDFQEDDVFEEDEDGWEDEENEEDSWEDEEEDDQDFIVEQPKPKLETSKPKSEAPKPKSVNKEVIGRGTQNSSKKEVPIPIKKPKPKPKKKEPIVKTESKPSNVEDLIKREEKTTKKKQSVEAVNQSSEKQLLLKIKEVYKDSTLTTTLKSRKLGEILEEDIFLYIRKNTFTSQSDLMSYYTQLGLGKQVGVVFNKLKKENRILVTGGRIRIF